jgi:hypothetical protein
MTRTSTLRKLIAAGGTATLVAVAMPTVFASTASAGTLSEGSCSGTSRYDLDVEAEHGGYEVEFEVDSNVPGQTWKVKLWQNDGRFLSRVMTTDREGEIDGDRHRANTPGADTFKLWAKNTTTGETCSAKVSRS